MIHHKADPFALRDYIFTVVPTILGVLILGIPTANWIYRRRQKGRTNDE